MPSTSNYAFEYESPSSLPGTTLTGGPGGGSPILAIQVDTALAAIESRVDINTDDIASNTASIAAGAATITDIQNWTRRGSTLVNFVTQDSFTAAVNFGFTFPGTPNVVTNIASGAGSTSRWGSRAITITTTGFTLFVFAPTAGLTQTWVDIPVGYIAHYD